MPGLNASDAESRQQTESDENSALALLTLVCPKPPGVPRENWTTAPKRCRGLRRTFLGRLRMTGSTQQSMLQPSNSSPRQDCLKAPSAGHGLPKELQWAGRQTWSRSCEAANKTKTGTLREQTLDRAIRAACKVDTEASRDRGRAPSGLRVGDCLTAGAVEGRYFVTTSSAADGVGKRVAALGFRCGSSIQFRGRLQ